MNKKKRLTLSLLPSSLLLLVFYLSIIFTTLLSQAPVLRVESLSIPFLVEKVDKELISEFVASSSPSSSFQKNDLSVFDEISDLCVSVFFNGDDDDEEENNGNNNIAPWKAVQLNHLRKLQFNDLKKKKNSASTSNMFIAREVLMMDSSSISSSSTKSKVLDLSQVTNAESLSNNNNNNNDYCLTTGKVIGFCQVSISHIGIATSNNNNNTNTTTDNNTTQQQQLQLQPRLTNLAVDPKFRESGIGSKLLSLCEETILSDTAYNFTSSSSSPNIHDKSKELYLQVEEDNKRAISFYLKRNYETIYSDPTTRRYDTNGLFLRNLRSTKITMKKILQQQQGTNVSSSSTVPFFFAS